MEVNMRKVPVPMLGLAIAMLAFPVLAAEPIALSSNWNVIGEQADRCAPRLTGGGKPPKWAIGPTEGKRRVAETTADTTDNRSPPCVLGPAGYGPLANVDVSVRWSPLAGSVAPARGLP